MIFLVLLYKLRLLLCFVSLLHTYIWICPYCGKWNCAQISGNRSRRRRLRPRLLEEWITFALKGRHSLPKSFHHFCVTTTESRFYGPLSLSLSVAWYHFGMCGFAESTTAGVNYVHSRNPCYTHVRRTWRCSAIDRVAKKALKNSLSTYDDGILICGSLWERNDSIRLIHISKFNLQSRQATDPLDSQSFTAPIHQCFKLYYHYEMNLFLTL